MRKKTKTKISLFSFQDIITSTTGILILISIILVFFLKLGADGTPSKPSPSQKELDDIKDQNEAIKSGNDYTNNFINMWAGRDFDEISDQVTDTIEQITVNSNRVSEFVSSNSEAAEIIEDNQSKSNIVEKLQMDYDAITNDITRIQNTLRGFAQANRMFVIPELPLGKNMIILVLGENKIDLAELSLDTSGKPQSQVKTYQAEAGKPANMRAQLLRDLQATNPKAKYHVVFFVRPSGLENFRQLSRFGGNAVKNLGFQTFGWDPLEEDTILDFK